jgi:triacylglycerol lipase
MGDMGRDDAGERTLEGPVRLVFLLHGILLNRWFLAPMAGYLRRRGFRVVNRSYPSTRRTIEEHAAALEEAVVAETRPLREADRPYQVNFVGHSLGGLVVRYLLSHRTLPGTHRFVLLAPPNNGSRKARRFGQTRLYRLVYGRRAGAQLASEPPGIFLECGIPAGVEMGILAGVGGTFFTVPTRVLSGQNDGVLTLEEVCLPGVPWKAIHCGHTTIVLHRRAMEEVAHFLEHGCFLPEAAVARAVEGSEIDRR